MTTYGERVAIVIPVYDRLDLLRETIASIYAQTYTNWELIVVNDGCADREVMKGMASEFSDDRIRWVTHTNNRGIAAARNSGVRATTSELVAIVDGDDLLAPSFLEELVRAFVADPSLDYAVTGMQCFGAHSRHVPFVMWTKESVLLRDYPPAGKMFRRRLWERVGGYDEDEAIRLNHEGWGFHIRAFTTGCNAVYLPRVLYLWRSRGVSTDRRLLEHRVRASIYRKHRDIFDASGVGRVFLATGYRIAAVAHFQRGQRCRALALAMSACCRDPRPYNFRILVKSVTPWRVILLFQRLGAARTVAV